MAQKLVCLTRWQISSRVDWLAVASDLEMQSRLAFWPLTHGRYFLAFFYLITFFDQQRRVVPVGTEVGVIMFENNKLAVTDQSTACIDDIPRCRSMNSLTGLAINQNTGAGAGLCAEFDVDPSLGWPGPLRWRLRRNGRQGL